MGLDFERFVDKSPLLDDLKCAICTEVLESPVQTSCDHLFCKECIEKWVAQGQNICPIDRNPLTIESLRPAPRITRQLLEKQVIWCKHYDQGCRLMVKLEHMPQLIKHEQDLCMVVKKDQIQEVQVPFNKELDDLKHRISKLEESLSIEANLHNVAKQVINEKEKKITDLMKTIQDYKKGNMEKTVKEDPEQLKMMLATSGVPNHPNPFALATAPYETDETNTVVPRETDLLSVDTNGQTKLYTAADNNNIGEVKVNIEGSKSLGILEDLVEKGTPKNNCTPLYISSFRGHTEVVSLLIKNKANINAPNVYGSTPLYVACQNNHLEVVTLLIKNKAKINQPMKDGKTPLYIASQQGHLRITKFLIENNASIDQATNDGGVPLSIAAQEGRQEVFKLLLKSGAAIDGRYHQKQTVLDVACCNNQYKMVELILSYDRGIALVNRNDNDYNDTPLTSAIQWDGDLQLVKLLISNGADKNIKGDNKTPLQWAKEKAKTDIVDYLKKC